MTLGSKRQVSVRKVALLRVLHALQVVNCMPTDEQLFNDTLRKLRMWMK